MFHDYCRHGRCDVGERCPYRHVANDNTDEDADLDDLRQWWADMTTLSREEYIAFVTMFKRNGPCLRCYTPNTLQCENFHTEMDRCKTVQLVNGEWVPPLGALSQIAQCFDPRFFKLRLCMHFPSCDNGRRCFFAHGMSELAAVRIYLRDLRHTLLLSDPTVQVR